MRMILIASLCACLVAVSLATCVMIAVPVQNEGTSAPHAVTILDFVRYQGPSGHAGLVLLLLLVVVAVPSFVAAVKAPVGRQMPLVCRLTIGLGAVAAFLGVFSAALVWTRFLLMMDRGGVAPSILILSSVAHVLWPIMMGGLTAVLSIAVYGLDVVLFERRRAKGMPSQPT